MAKNNDEMWSREEFGHADLGNSLRTQRLVAVAAAAAERPAGRVTEVFDESMDREGAYRMLESDKVDGRALLAATQQATAVRCSSEPYVFVPVDGSSLSLKDPQRIRGLGTVGPYKKGGQGLEVMNAIAVSPSGTPLGLLEQIYWVREQKSGRKQTRRKRTLEEKETRYWLDVSHSVCSALKEHGDGVVPWFQFDRGGDFREGLLWATETDAWVTVRAAQNRKVKDEEARLLWEQMERQKPSGRYEMNVTARPKRQARRANMEVRYCEVTLMLTNHWLKTKPKEVRLRAVLTQEKGTTPDGEKPLQWLLLTNREISNFNDAVEVIFAYAQRWKIEEFHKTWKSTCRVEETQLRSVESIGKWATILAAVAIRIERLKYFARNNPQAPATVEFTPGEIDAIIVMKKPKGYQRDDVPTIETAVRWLAELGGYTGKNSGGPPGSIVIGRGLKRIEPVVTALQNLADIESDSKT